ncbi:DUF977 family protein [Shigella sonnei]|nr:DUF977 family protein [Shigella sonnei]
METVFDALKALKRASSHVVASRLGISREDAVNELWKLKRRGEADNKGSMWWLIQAGESEPVSPVPKVTAQMLTEAIEQHGPQTADELALMFGITSRRANSSLAMAISKGRLIRVNQGGKFRYCIPGADLPAEPKAASIAETDGKVFPQPAGVALPVQEAATQEDWSLPDGEIRRYDRHQNIICRECRKSEVMQRVPAFYQGDFQEAVL